MLIRFIISLPFLLSACTHLAVSNENRSPKSVGAQQSCQITAEEKERLMNLDYQSFDQTLPDGGWRKYQYCDSLMQDLLDTYTSRNEKNLQPQQKNVLVWHSGQVTAFLGDYPGAIARMEKTFKDENQPAVFQWNAYVRASIAFLNKDLKALQRARNQITKGTSPFNHINLRIVDSFIRCFDSSYKNAYSHTCEPKETNTERIKSLAIELPSDSIPPGIQEFLQQKKVILIGEMHGTKEIPALFGRLVKSVAADGKKTLVVLEITQSSQSAIDKFLETGDESALKADSFFNRQYQDGRSSKAMVDLLKDLSRVPNIKVLCMDPMIGNNTMSGQDRDSGMASLVFSNMKAFERTIVLSGNVHSSTVVGTPWDSKYRPMGYELMSLAKEVNANDFYNILVRYEKLGSWNCQGSKVIDCKSRISDPVATDYSRAVSWKSFFVNEGSVIDNHLGTIFIRQTHPSTPAFAN